MLLLQYKLAMANKHREPDELQQGLDWLLDEFTNHLSGFGGGNHNRDSVRRHNRTVSIERQLVKSQKV